MLRVLLQQSTTFTEFMGLQMRFFFPRLNLSVFYKRYLHLSP